MKKSATGERTRRDSRWRKPVAVIDIGSTAIRLLVAEIQGPGEWRVLEVAEQPCPLGRQVFVEGHVNRRGISQVLQILKGFGELIAPYDVGELRAIGTSAIREAQNREPLLDRIRLQVGLKVEIIDGTQANYLTYLAVRYGLATIKPSLGRGNSLIIEVGGGSTEVMLLQRGRMVAAHSLAIGTVRLDHTIQSTMEQYAGGSLVSTLLRENVQSTLEGLKTEMRLQRISRFVAIGGDVRRAALAIGADFSEGHAIISRKDFCAFVERIEHMSPAELADRLAISYADAESLLPALVVQDEFLSATCAEELIVPKVSIRDGLLHEMTQRPRASAQYGFQRQVVASAVSLGKKYRIDMVHARYVADVTLDIFDHLSESHGLNKRQRLLMETAAILHDIGHFINFSAHHKHGQYIIANSDIFGLHREDIAIVAAVVRYHRKSAPAESHPEYAQMSSEDRVTVSKLASILRIAEALDRSHTQRLVLLSVESDEEELVLTVPDHYDLTLDRLSLRGKTNLFEDVFGMYVALVGGESPQGL